jgi:hypothetical protein
MAGEYQRVRRRRDVLVKVLLDHRDELGREGDGAPAGGRLGFADDGRAVPKLNGRLLDGADGGRDTMASSRLSDF